jgi:hypothetical protein
MPWPPRQRRAIAARMSREGKSHEQISRFFHEHGYGAKDKLKRKKRRRRRRTQ